MQNDSMCELMVQRIGLGKWPRGNACEWDGWMLCDGTNGCAKGGTGWNGSEHRAACQEKTSSTTTHQLGRDYFLWGAVRDRAGGVATQGEQAAAATITLDMLSESLRNAHGS